MTTTQPIPSSPRPPAEEPYQPTPAQLERAAAQRRFNALYVYTPLVIFSLLFVGFLVAMIYFAVVRDPWRPMVSAVADLLVILAIVPLLLLSALLPAGAIALFVEGRRREWQPYRTIQVLFWRLDSLVARVQRMVLTGADWIAPYTVRFRATFIRIETTARSLVQGKTTEESEKRNGTK
jgi:hypothetical protein